MKRESGANPERYQSLYVFCGASSAKAGHWETEKAEAPRENTSQKTCFDVVPQMRLRTGTAVLTYAPKFYAYGFSFVRFVKM